MFIKKNISLRIIYFPILITVFLFLLSFNQVSAESVLPGVSGDAGFFELVRALINILIALAAMLAVVFITIGGLQYMTTDSISGKEDGKNTIKNALLGLLLALVSWLILFTINPSLVKFEVKGISYKPESYFVSVYQNE